MSLSRKTKHGDDRMSSRRLIDPDKRNQLFLKYHKIIDFFLPVGSKRRLVLITVVNSLLTNRNDLHFENIDSFNKSIRNVLSDFAEAIRHSVSNGPPNVVYNQSPLQSLIYDNISDIQSMSFGCTSAPKVSIVIPVLNKWIYTYHCLRFISKLQDSISFEVIVVDNGSSDETPKMLALMKGLRVIRNDSNMGFVEACNNGAEVSQGEYILFLNNDAMIMNGSLDSMGDLMAQDQKIGAVGAKLVYPDGRLQEAGGVVWNDGLRIAWNFGKFDDPGRYEYNYVRETDYCSGACLMVRRDTFFRIGLFDAEFAPAYFEDTNLCFAMRKIGYKTVYQPKAVAIHYEGITAGTDVRKGVKLHQTINRKKFHDRWQHLLTTEHYANGENIFLARERPRDRQTMLYIDHEIPSFDKDAGSMITFEYLKLFLSLDFKIVFWPANLREAEPYMSEMQQMGIEVVYGYVNFDRYMRKYGRYFDFVIISRPFTAISFLKKLKVYSQAKILYVAHDLHFVRELRRAELDKNEKLGKFAVKLKQLELSIAQKSDITLVFSDFEKRVLEAEDPGLNIELMPWIQKVNTSGPSFDNSKDLMFIGSFRHLPNIDGVLWFVNEVFPRIRRHLPQAQLFIVGSDPTPEILALNGDGIVVTGYVKDTSPYFLNCRVFVAPLRYGAGVKGKVIEAASYGLPVVTTQLGAEGLNLKNGKNVLIADDPGGFAQQVVSVYSSRDLWLKLSVGAIDYMKAEHSPDRAMTKFRRLLQPTYV